MSRKLLIFLALAIPLGLARAQDSKENADFKLALNLYNDKFYDLALEQFRQFISFYPNSPQGIDARFYLGLIQVRLGQLDEARFTFQNFALSYPDNPKAPEAWMKVGEIFVAAKNPREAALAYERVRTFHPRSKQAPEALKKAADLFEDLGDRANAMRVIKLLTQEYASADILSSRLRLVEYYLDAGQTEAATQEVRKVVEGTKEPGPRSRALLLSARIALTMGRSKDAEVSLQDIVSNYRSSSSGAEALVLLGDLRQAAGNLTDASAAWRSVADDSVKAPPSIRQQALLRIGDLAMVRRDAGAARRSYESASRIPGPRQGLSAFKAGRLAEQSGDTVSAARWYERCSADTSSYVDRIAVLVAGVKAARWQARFEDVVMRADAALTIAPKDGAMPRVILWAADALEHGSNDVRRALAWYERGLAAPTVADEAALGKARCLRATGDLEGARLVLEQFPARYPYSEFRPSAAALLRSIVYFETRDREAGTEQLALLLGDVIGGTPRATLAFRLAEISFLQLKNYRLARTQYLRALGTDLENGLRAQAWMKAAQSAEYESERPGATPAERLSLLMDARSSYDSLFLQYPESPLAADAITASIRVRALTVAAGAEFKALVKDADSLSLRHRRRDAILSFVAARAEQLKATDEMLSLSSTIAELTSDADLSGDAAVRIATVLGARGDEDTAKTILARFVERSPAHPRAAQALLQLASWAAKKGDISGVDGYADQLAQRAPYVVEPTDILLLKADAAFNARQYSAAATLYSSFTAALHNDRLVVRRVPVEVVYHQAIALQNAGQPDDAARLYAEVIARETQPDVLLTCYTALAAIAEARNDVARASGFMQEAARLTEKAGGNTSQIAMESAELLFRNEQYADAVTKYSELLSKADKDSLKNRLEARIIVSYLRMNNLKEADRRIQAFVKKNPKAQDAVAEFEFERGKYLVRKEQPVGARERLELVVRQYAKSPSAAEAWFWYGRTFELEENLPRAAEVYDSVLHAYPSHPITPRVQLNLGNVYYTLEQWDKAAPLFKALLDSEQRAPDLVQYAMNNLILTYKEQTLYDAALQLTRSYIQRFPEDPDLINKRIDIGVLYQKLGYYDQSIVHLQTLMQTAGSDLEAELRYYIGESYYSKGDYQQAILEFLKVPYLVGRKGPVDWVATSYYMAGQSYEKMSRFDQAIAMYKQIVDRPGIDAQFKTAASREIDRVRQLTGKN